MPDGSDKGPDKPKSMPVLMPDRIGQSEDKERRFVIDIEYGVTLEQVMEPSYWAHVASQMQQFDEIKVRTEDGAWCAFLMVKYAERNYVSVVLDRVIHLDKEVEIPAQSEKHKVEWKGPRLRFCVTRIADQKRVKEGCLSRDEGLAWIIEHEKT